MKNLLHSIFQKLSKILILFHDVKTANKYIHKEQKTQIKDMNYGQC